MLIPFDQMEETVLQRMRDGEGFVASRMYQDSNNKIMRGRLEPGCSIGLHTHQSNSEVIYILSGAGKVLCDGEYEPLTAGSCHYCPQGHTHSLINDSDGPLVFLAVVPEHSAPAPVST